MQNKEQTRLKQEAIPAFCYYKVMSKFKHKYILCPICQKHKFPEPGDRFDVCPYCGWVHDDVSEDEECLNIAIGPNDKSFLDHKARYLQTIKDNPDFYYNRDGYPEEDEE